MAISDYDLWRITSACSIHFRGSYDAFKFNFKAKNLSPRVFAKNKQRVFYSNVARKLDSERDAVRYAFSNIFFAEKTFIRDMTFLPYDQYNTRLQSFGYKFGKDLKKYSYVTFDQLLSARGEYPLILTEYMSGNVLPETVIVLHILTNFLNRIQIDDELLWPELKTKLIKATPFIRQDLPATKKYREIVLGVYS